MCRCPARRDAEKSLRCTTGKISETHSSLSFALATLCPWRASSPSLRCEADSRQSSPAAGQACRSLALELGCSALESTLDGPVQHDQRDRPEPFLGDETDDPTW